MRRLVLSLGAASLLIAATATAAFAGHGPLGPPAGVIYAGGGMYRTIGTPTDFSSTGAPLDSFEPIYAFSTQANVALAAPGEPGFKGGRWVVYPVTWTQGVQPYTITDGAGVLAAAAAGDLTVASTPVKEFECPLIPFPAGH
jgi:hypothetical protein